MADPGYGSNGERTDAAGLVVWINQAPPIPVVEGYDTHMVYTLGSKTLPWIDQADDDCWQIVLTGTLGTPWAAVPGSS